MTHRIAQAGDTARGMRQEVKALKAEVISERTLASWVAEGRVPVVRVGGRTRRTGRQHPQRRITTPVVWWTYVAAQVLIAWGMVRLLWELG